VKRELLELAVELSRRGEPFALATVVARRSPMSAQPGDTALVTRGGGFHGWVGGSCTRPTVIAQALEALADHQPRLVALDPDPESHRRPGLTVFPMTCHSGGSVEIHIQPVLPPPELVVFGASPTARALVRLGEAMGYRVHAVEPDADESTFPGADRVVTSPAALELARRPLYAVVATQGEWDEEALRAAAAHAPDYLAVVASPRRFAQMRALLAPSIPEALLARVKNPAGLAIGAKLPEEIALGILAEIVKERAEARPQAPAAPAAEVRDPVCGMNVRPEPGAPRAEHGGRTYHFCCGGCQQRFVAAPERYL
jgi:xanthine dehydrogenase accessory factor